MRPQLLESDVESLEGDVNVDEIHSAFYESFLDCRQVRKQIPDWLKESDPDDYQERVDTMEYYEHVQGEMAAWLSRVDDETVSAVTVAEKYAEFKQEFLKDADDPNISFF